MATAASIPPELFEGILYYVCEDTDELRHPDDANLGYRQRATLKNVAACSLACVYWARTCRPRMFRRVWIKSYERLLTLRLLISNTPKAFDPISEYIWYATLVQRIEDRPWLYRIQLNPSLLPPLPFASLRIHLVDSADKPQTPRRSTYRRLSSGLPRTLPSTRHPCHNLTLHNPYFESLNDIALLLDKFSFPFGSTNVTLTDVSWASEISLERDLITRSSLLITRRNVDVVVDRSEYSAETAWLAYSAIMRNLNTPVSTFENDGEIRLHLQPSAQRAIVELGRLICWGGTTGLALRTTLWDTSPHDGAYGNCFLGMQRYEPYQNRTDVDFRLHTPAQCAANVAGDTVIVSHVAAISVSIKSMECANAVNDASAEISRIAAAYPWKDIASLWARYEWFTQLQLHFVSRDDLVQFMEACRSALAILIGRIALFYRAAEDSKLHAADFETLDDLGDAWNHGYINTY